MPIVYHPFITLGMVLRHPDRRFVFGDNIRRKGTGGQAYYGRDRANCIGVATKRYPSMEAGAFMADNSPEDHAAVLADLFKVKAAMDANLIVYVPVEGIGTGMAQLPMRAPRLYTAIKLFFATNSKDGFCPWRP